MNILSDIYLSYLNSFLFSSIQMLLYVTIPFIADRTSIPNHHLSGSISIGSLLVAFSGPFLSSLTDKYGRKKILALSLFGLALSFIILSLIIIYPSKLSLNSKISLMYISRICFGLLSSAIIPATQALLLDISKANSHLRVLTKNSMALNLGKIIAPILVLIQFINYEFLILILTLFILILAIVQLQKAKKEKIENNLIENFSFKSFILIMKDTKLPFFLALFFTGFIGVMHSTLGNHLKIIFNIKGQDATILMAKIILVISILGFFIQYLSSKLNFSWFSMLNLGAISIIIGAFTLSEANSLNEVWIAIFIVSIGFALIPPVYLNLFSKKTSNEAFYGKKIGIASIAHSLGYALGTGIAALSLKMNLFSITYTILFISILVGIVTALLNKNKAIYV
jgi:MFS family permease